MYSGPECTLNDRVMVAMDYEWCLLKSYTIEEIARIGAIAEVDVLEAIVELKLPTHYSYPYMTMLRILNTVQNT